MAKRAKANPPLFTKPCKGAGLIATHGEKIRAAKEPLAQTSLRQVHSSEPAPPGDAIGAVRTLLRVCFRRGIGRGHGRCHDLARSGETGMSNPVDYGKILDAAKAVNVCRFPRGIMLWRHSHGGWSARIMREDTETIAGVAPDANGSTCEDAIEGLRAMLLARLRDTAERHARDLDAANAAMGAIGGSA